jgi:dTDP-4-dehydrorhamnose reductase
MRIALLGATGQLGTELRHALKEVVPVTHADSDLTETGRLQAVLDRIQPELVINAAAYTRVDQAEDEPDRAFDVNALAVRHLARWCNKTGTTLLYLSTDYVFGLEQGRTTPCRETDPPGPISVYGMSKLAGEYFVQSECDRHYVIRTCGLYGPVGRIEDETGQADVRPEPHRHKNFVETMLRLAKKQPEVRVVDDQTCTPTCTRDLAEFIERLITTGAYGLYHLTNSGETTWCGFAREIFRRQGLTTAVVPISSEEFGAPARRPSFSVLDCEKAMQATGLRLRPWQDALAEYLAHRS